MTYGAWAIFMYAVGIVLIVAELFLPTHGLVAALGGIAILGGIGACFLVHPWLGVAAFVGSMAAAPFAFTLALRLMPRTRAGRELILPPVDPSSVPLPVQIGATGFAVSELRPVGLCEFDGKRVEAASELGIIPAGRRIVVVNLNNRQPIVRAV